MHSVRDVLCAFVVVGVVAPVTALADDWELSLTVDNYFDAYFGTPTTTNYFAGSGDWWPTTWNFTATGREPSDYLYIATSSDQNTAQGFLGTFTNTTNGLTVNTGAAEWQVFAAGPHLQTLFGMNGAWPSGVKPTQAQVDTAIAFATANGWWESTDGLTDWDNRSVGNVTTWGHRPGIPDAAEWIWHNKGGYASPFNPGVDHDEFLVFRVVGAAPAPGAVALLGLIGLGGARRRSRNHPAAS